jgi:hypothetical protein
MVVTPIEMTTETARGEELGLCLPRLLPRGLTQRRQHRFLLAQVTPKRTLRIILKPNPEECAVNTAYRRPVTRTLLVTVIVVFADNIVHLHDGAYEFT